MMSTGSVIFTKMSELNQLAGKSRRSISVSQVPPAYSPCFFYPPCFAPPRASRWISWVPRRTSQSSAYPPCSSPSVDFAPRSSAAPGCSPLATAIGAQCLAVKNLVKSNVKSENHITNSRIALIEPRGEALKEAKGVWGWNGFVPNRRCGSNRRCRNPWCQKASASRPKRAPAVPRAQLTLSSSSRPSSPSHSLICIHWPLFNFDSKSPVCLSPGWTARLSGVQPARCARDFLCILLH